MFETPRYSDSPHSISTRLIASPKTFKNSFENKILILILLHNMSFKLKSSKWVRRMVGRAEGFGQYLLRMSAKIGCQDDDESS